MTFRPCAIAWLGCLAMILIAGYAPAEEPLRAGAYVVDITPPKYPVIVNGMFEQRTANSAHDPLHARALVLESGTTRIAIVVVDSCMLPRDLIDQSKTLASKATGIPTENMLVSATHTHSAPSVMHALGSNPDPDYIQFLIPQIARSIELAAKQVVPARIGWAVVQDWEHTHCRRWIRRPDRLLTDPFGQQNVRANMHPGHESPDAIGPAGPVDPDLTVLSVQALDGRPIAVLANYAMHYYGSPLLSADYFGAFCERFARKITPPADAGGSPPLVCILSAGPNGDLWWGDYGQPKPKSDLDAYSAALASRALDAYKKIEYQEHPALVMREAKLKLRRRVPDEKRLAWARPIVEKLGDRLPNTKEEIYAREQFLLHENPTAELKLQAIRIGELGIVAIPNEVYAITGLKLKAQSPFATTFAIELANGAEGYIPPPEQHKMGGYTTWNAMTAGLEVEAEPKILETLLKLLEQVSGKTRQKPQVTGGKYAEVVLASKPMAYWRLDELCRPFAMDASEGNRFGFYDDFVAFGLEGPVGANMASNGRVNRAAHFAGGRIVTGLVQWGETVAIPLLPPPLGSHYSVEMWFWNGLPADARKVSGYIFSRGDDKADGAPGDHLGIGGTEVAPGKLFFFNGNANNQVLPGTTELRLKTWYHVVLVREDKNVTVYLNGNTTPEISGQAEVVRNPNSREQIFIGGRSDNFANFEGKIDEVSVYDRALNAEEAAAHYRAAGMPQQPAAPVPPPAAEASKPSSPPRSPEESLKLLHVRDGFRVELVAAEPLVMDPVAIAWGADGKMWVAEMADYPLGMDGKMSPGGRVRYLEDTDGDGRYDKSTVFIDHVNFPNGVLPWRNGVLVTAAPEIFFAEDTDGDGRADKRTTVLRGFKEGNPQLRINGLRYGLDNWVYCANGWSAGNIESIKTGAKASLEGRDLCFRPDDGRIDLVAGVTQFGRNRDDWGNWFGCNNSRPLWHFVLADEYMRRNPHVPSPDPIEELMTPRNPKVYPRSKLEKRYHSFEQSGRFTSACSAMIYRDELLFPRGEVEHAFVCEPFHNLVHHEVLTPRGVTFSAKRPDEEKESEFLASEDRWFRPVMAQTGPDGALWVVDMYRYMIEHPEWLPPNGKTELEPLYRAGDDRGRIYRIVPEGKSPRPIPRLDKLSTPDLVAALDSPNGPVRDLVQQQLIWRADAAAVPLLEKLAIDNTNPLARLHAFCTLDGLGKLRAENIEKALADKHPGVRRHVVRLMEPFFGDHPQLVIAAIKLVDDPDPQVRLQLAWSFGQCRQEWIESAFGVGDGKVMAQCANPEVARALAHMAIKNADDPYILAAAMSSLTRRNVKFVYVALVTGNPGRSLPARLLVPIITTAAAMGEDQVVLSALNPETISGGSMSLAAQFNLLSEVMRGLERCYRSLKDLRDPTPGETAAIATKKYVANLTIQARQVTLDEHATETDRIAAIGVLALVSELRSQDITQLGTLLSPRVLPAIQAAVVAQLGRLKEQAAAEAMVEDWRSHSPELRKQILAALLSREEWTTLLMDRIEHHDIAPADIDATSRLRLTTHKNEAIRNRAGKLLAFSADADREKVVQQLHSVLQLAGDAQRGAVVFEKKCATCHKLGNVGHDVGANLAALTDKSPGFLLVSILDPSRAVDSRFVNYVAQTTDGRSFSGALAETGNSIVLTGPEGKQQTILRSELEELRSTGKSLMPDGLEKDLSPQDLADVIAFVRGAQP